MKLRLALVCLGLLALSWPAQALAAKCAPPGTSGVAQYIETIPGGSCNHRTGGRGHGHGGALPPGAQSALTSEGPAGREVANLVLSTGTAPRPRSPQSRSSVGPVSGQSWPSGLLHPVLAGSSSGGMGPLLLILLSLALVIALVLAAFRRARPGS